LLISFINLFASCELSVSTAKVDNVQMCRNLKGEICDQDIQIFSPDDKLIYISCNLENAPSNTIVSFIWKFVEGQSR